MSYMSHMHDHHRGGRYRLLCELPPAATMPICVAAPSCVVLDVG
jgi:hypothetical protein